MDGGLTKNRYLTQRQADLLGLPAELGPGSEATATGAAVLAAISAGLLEEQQAKDRVTTQNTFEPRISEDERETEYARWLDWLQQARSLHRQQPQRNSDERLPIAEPDE